MRASGTATRGAGARLAALLAPGVQFGQRRRWRHVARSTDGVIPQNGVAPEIRNAVLRDHDTWQRPRSVNDVANLSISDGAGRERIKCGHVAERWVN